MNPQELQQFLMQLQQYSDIDKKRFYAKLFYDEMLAKYGNQFIPNGVFEQFLDVLHDLGL